jgi:flagellin
MSSMSIRTNTASLDAHNNLVNTADELKVSMERLSSGYRINTAADDAAGYAISEKLDAQVSGLQQAQQNAQDATSLVQTAEGAINTVQSMLQRVRDLAVEYNNGTLDSADQAAITNEVAQLCQEISQISSQTSFNGIALLSGGATITFQVGANDGETIAVTALSLFGSGTSYDIDSSIFNFSGATVTLASIDAALDNVSQADSTFGAVQNRLTDTLTNLASYQENLSAAMGTIKDTDMASEMANFTSLQVLQQAGTSMLSQANTNQQNILRLLQGG